MTLRGASAPAREVGNRPGRVVSLLPSATEILYLLGAGDLLVGRSEECDYPPAVSALPVVMRARTRDADRPSAEIDARVQAVRGAGESLYVLDLEKLQALRPEVIFTQDLCGVCSVTEEEVRRACRAVGLEAAIVSLSPRTLPEVAESIRTVARAVGRDRTAEAILAELEARERRAGRRGDRRPPRLAVIEWVDPPILAGLWAPDQITGAGGRPMEGVHSGAVGVRTSWPELARAAPEIAVVSPCSFSVERTERELAAPGISRAVARLGCPVWIADEAYFSRPGPRLWDGLELLHDLVDGAPRRTPRPVHRWTGAGAEAVA